MIPRLYPSLERFARARLALMLRGRYSVAELIDSACGDALANAEAFSYQGDPEALRYLKTVLLNKVWAKMRYDRRSRRDLRRQQPLDSGFDVRDDVDTPSEVAVQHEDFGRLQDALARLPDRYREVIHRRKFLGEDHEDVARAMRVAPHALSNLLHRALVRLASLMDTDGDSNGHGNGHEDLPGSQAPGEDRQD